MDVLLSRELSRNCSAEGACSQDSSRSRIATTLNELAISPSFVRPLSLQFTTSPRPRQSMGNQWSRRSRIGLLLYLYQYSLKYRYSPARQGVTPIMVASLHNLNSRHLSRKHVC